MIYMRTEDGDRSRCLVAAGAATVEVHEIVLDRDASRRCRTRRWIDALRGRPRHPDAGTHEELSSGEVDLREMAPRS